MDQYKTPKRPLIVYFAIFILAIFLFNMLLMPLLTRTPETTYDDFLSKLEAGQVKVVQMSRDTEEILFQTEEDGKTRIYSLGQMEDGTALTQRLEGSGVKFGAVIPQQPSMLGSILSWLLPIVVMLLGSQLLFRSLQKRMGGPNSMQFGKSSAKVYVSAQTGIRLDRKSVV